MIMKIRILLSAIACIGIQHFCSAQTISINWSEDSVLTGGYDQILKRTGYLTHDAFRSLNLYFRYDLSGLTSGHRASLCFGDNCYFLSEGEDIPTERTPQKVNPFDQIYVVADIYPELVAGTSTIRYTLFDSADANVTFPFTVRFVATPTSVAEATEQQMQLWPNPAHSVVSIQSGTFKPVAVDIYSAQGAIVASHRASGDLIQFPVSMLAAGAYVVVCTDAQDQRVRYPLTITR
jgi:hypothetical protein